MLVSGGGSGFDSAGFWARVANASNKRDRHSRTEFRALLISLAPILLPILGLNSKLLGHPIRHQDFLVGFGPAVGEDSSRIMAHAFDHDAL